MFQNISAMMEASVLNRIDQKKIPRRAMAIIMHIAVSWHHYGKTFRDKKLIGSLSHTWELELALIPLLIYFQSRNQSSTSRNNVNQNIECPNNSYTWVFLEIQINLKSESIWTIFTVQNGYLKYVQKLIDDCRDLIVAVTD